MLTFKNSQGFGCEIIKFYLFHNRLIVKKTSKNSLFKKRKVYILLNLIYYLLVGDEWLKPPIITFHILYCITAIHPTNNLIKSTFATCLIEEAGGKLVKKTKKEYYTKRRS